jgi:hypothetical protein
VRGAAQACVPGHLAGTTAVGMEDARPETVHAPLYAMACRFPAGFWPLK